MHHALLFPRNSKDYGTKWLPDSLQSSKSKPQQVDKGETRGYMHHSLLFISRTKVCIKDQTKDDTRLGRLLALLAASPASLAGRFVGTISGCSLFPHTLS